ncbi:FecCD family ABC transporter permease [Kiloniella laminariae]|uniref:FecCD family ABC transporter permease n=1 Tax=Kiloniella laminariae TaxID=454162 RepID=UPI00036E35D7|nr:iron ABC transporter permease [Kiloniella laminariae]
MAYLSLAKIRRRKKRDGASYWLLPLLLAGLFIAVLLSLGIGGVSIPPLASAGHFFSYLGFTVSDLQPQEILILEAVRLPRTALGLAIGMALGLSGAVMQSLFRNPLADPGLIGVSSGAALAVVCVIVLGDTLFASFLEATSSYSLPLAAFAGSLATTALVYNLARREGATDVAVMLLMGIAVNAIVGSFIGLLTYIADDSELRSLTFWSMGSLSGAGEATWPSIGIMVLASLLLLRLSGPLNLFLLGETEAKHLGVATEGIKRQAALAAACATGAAVAAAGMIGFIGLIAPHLARLIGGADNRFVLPAAALLGALLIIIADTIARIIVLPAELPIGLVTSFIGGPFFFALLFREFRKRRA